MRSELFPEDVRQNLHERLNHLTGETAMLTDDIAWMRIVMVNVYFVGKPGAVDPDGGWTLIDGGLPMSSRKIRDAAENLYGPGAKPAAIILTHGHFDHVGALPDLLKTWDVPIYVHALDRPYITGHDQYPPPDPTVARDGVGGVMPRIISAIPRSQMDLTGHVRLLPDDGSVPTLDGWRWIHTPGHAPGHVSFFRESDRTLIAGDAFVTQNQDSLSGVISHEQKVFGPPRLMTPDWISAAESVRALAALDPEVAGCGHGNPMSGERLRTELTELAERFEEIAVPSHGRYVPSPARFDENGVRWLPAKPADPLPKLIVAAALAAGVAAYFAARKSSPSEKEI